MAWQDTGSTYSSLLALCVGEQEERDVLQNFRLVSGTSAHARVAAEAPPQTGNVLANRVNRVKSQMKKKTKKHGWRFVAKMSEFF